jgi:hypothetical protein
MYDLITRFSVERLTLRPLDTGREIINEMQQAHEPKMEYRKQIARTRRSSAQQSQTDPTICTAGPDNLWPETLTCSDHVQVSLRAQIRNISASQTTTAFLEVYQPIFGIILQEFRWPMTNKNLNILLRLLRYWTKGSMSGNVVDS